MVRHAGAPGTYPPVRAVVRLHDPRDVLLVEDSARLCGDPAPALLRAPGDELLEPLAALLAGTEGDEVVELAAPVELLLPQALVAPRELVEAAVGLRLLALAPEAVLVEQELIRCKHTH